MPDFTCDYAQQPRPFPHHWEHTVGSGHAALSLRADWQEQMRRCHEELGFEHVRFHNILGDDMGTLVCEENEFVYSFFNADSVWDFLLSIGMRPFVELSFMPYTLSSGNQIVFHYKANVTPPRDYKQWATLINKLVTHWVDRYGLDEVRHWFFEVWNEPNLKAFWAGDKADYFKLYRNTVEAIKKVDAMLQVGGPATATNAWIPDFLDFCERNDLPADFVSTHYYPTDAFGKIGADTITQLANAPRDIMLEQALKTRDQARGRPVYYTEWNASSNPRGPLHDEPYTAAFVARTVMQVNELVNAYSFWTFTDIFSENYFPSIPFHGGFGLMNLQGIPKPVYRAYQLLHHLGTELLPVQGGHETVDAWVTRKAQAATALLTNHAFPRHPIKTEQVCVKLVGTPEPVAVIVERVDEEHANPKKLWEAMGQPEYLSALDVERLESASALKPESLPYKYEKGVLSLALSLPPHAVAAISILFAEGQPV